MDKDKIEVPGMTLSDEELDALSDSDEKEFAEGMGPEGPEDVKTPAAGEEEGGGEEAGSEGDGEEEGSDAGEEENAGEEEGSEEEDEGKDASKAGADEQGEEGAAEGGETASDDKDKKSAADADAATPPPEGEDKKDEAKGTEGTAEGEDDEDSPLPVLLTPPSKAELEKAEADYKSAQEKFNEGEIDYAEFRQAERTYLELSIEARQTEKFNSQLVLRQWEADQDRFLRAYPSLKDNQMLRGVLANTVNDLFKTPEWADKPGMKVLNEAKRLIEAGLGIKIARKGEGKTALPSRSEKETRQEEGRKLARKAVEAEAEKARNTVTLRGAPAAASNTPEKNPWAHIDRLEGDAYQRAINNMTDAQRRAYEDAH